MKLILAHLSVFEVAEAAGGLFRGGHLLGSHLIPHLALNLLLALLAGLNSMKPAGAWQTLSPLNHDVMKA